MIFKREPALWLGLVVVILNLLIVFGVNLSADQVAAINAVAGAVVALIVRQTVTAPKV